MVKYLIFNKKYFNQTDKLAFKQNNIFFKYNIFLENFWRISKTKKLYIVKK
jgi:hypothetical protein